MEMEKKEKIKCKNFEECGEYLSEKQIKRGKKYYSHPCALKVVSIWTPEKRTKASIKQKEVAEKLISEGKHTLQKLKKVHYSEDKFAMMHPYLERQHGFKRFLFDFYDEQSNTDIEIDGSMHLREDRVKHDIERDAICKEAGFNVARIPAKLILQNQFVEWRNFK